MVTTGSVDINLTPISNTVNNATDLADKVTKGIADQGTDIGEAVGITITVLFYIGLIIIVLGIIFLIFNWIKSVRKRGKGGGV